MEASKLETEACLFISRVNIWRLEKKKRRREGETVAMMLLEKLPTGMSKLGCEPLSLQLHLHERLLRQPRLQDKVQMKTAESARPRVTLHSEYRLAATMQEPS